MAGALTFLAIALVTLPLAGVPLAVWAWLDYRKYCLRAKIEDRLHRLVSR
jgi:hypothetical protein